MIQLIMFEIKRRFEKALEEKTNWGRNEVKRLYDQTMIEVLAEYVSKSEQDE